MDRCCPACGQTLPPSSSFADVALTPTQRIIVAAVVGSGQNGISLDRLHEMLYCDREDGGPDYVTLRTHIRDTNKKLRPEGARIASFNYGRGHHGSYRMEKK